MTDHLANLLRDVAEKSPRAIQIWHTNTDWHVTYIDDSEFNPYQEHGHGPTLDAAIAAMTDKECPICEER